MLKPLTPIQVKTLDLLLQGNTITDTARELQIDRSNIHHWIAHHPAFTIAYQQARQRHQDDVLDRYYTLAAPALKLLETMMNDETLPPHHRMRIAQGILRSVGDNGPAIPFTPGQQNQLHQLLQQIPTNPHTESDTSKQIPTDSRNEMQAATA